MRKENKGTKQNRKLYQNVENIIEDEKEGWPSEERGGG